MVSSKGTAFVLTGTGFSFLAGNAGRQTEKGAGGAIDYSLHVSFQFGNTKLVIPFISPNLIRNKSSLSRAQRIFKKIKNLLLWNQKYIDSLYGNPVWENKEDSLAQLVEHNTFNVGVSGFETLNGSQRKRDQAGLPDILKCTLSSVGRAADS